MPQRAFVAVPVGPLPRLKALGEALRGLPADVKVVDPEHYHLTLSFLGDVADDAPPRIAAALDGAVVGAAPFSIQFAGVGAFQSPQRPRVVWAGVEDEAALQALAARVRPALAAAGFPGDDKPFRAHLTLARVRSPRGAPHVTKFVLDHKGDALDARAVEGVRLYRSVLGHGGPRYDVLHETRLGAA